MQRNYLFIFAMALGVITCSSCEVPVEIEGDSKIVVQSYFSNTQDLIVYVTESNLRTSTSYPIYIENAAVTVFSGETNEFLTGLTLVRNNGQSFYQTVGFQPEIETLYLLNVEVPGYQPVTATNSIPKPSSLEAVFNDSSTFNGVGMQHVSMDVAISIEDPAGHENYYHILFYQELIDSTIDADGLVSSDIIYLDSDGEIFIESKTKAIDIKQLQNHPSFLIMDKQFDGQKFIIDFDVQFEFDPEIYTRGNLLIEMRTVSKEYYEHYLNLIPKPGQNPLSPSVIDDNIINGAGVFAGYSFKSIRL